MSKGNIFVTGGAGFIGSHTALVLLEEGYAVTVMDNLDNSFEEAVNRVRELAGLNGKHLKFVQGDLCTPGAVADVLKKSKFDCVIHFAGRKYVNESVEDPLLYYRHNVMGTVLLLEAMAAHGVKSLVFSSSCTVYGNPTKVPIDESHPLCAVSPYGRTKLMIEDMLRDVAKSDPEWRVALLRYFNPVGAHPSGRIGEHQVKLNNLMPWVQAVALKQHPTLSVYGTDYKTPDGTCLRDYIHVVDLARGHVAAVDKLEASPEIGAVAYNLGTGTGTTVLQMVKAFEKASRLKVPCDLVGRRPGDAEAVWAATETAERELGWKATLDVEDMCRDQWRWAQANPEGYGKKK